MTNAPKDAGSGLVLLTGATGYVGGRLLRALAERGRRVRCLALLLARNEDAPESRDEGVAIPSWTIYTSEGATTPSRRRPGSSVSGDGTSAASPSRRMGA